MFSKAFFRSLFFFYRSFLRKFRISPTPPHGKSPKYPSLEKLPNQVLVCDVEGGLLRSSSTFPYFMLVALEAGGFLRGLLLLLLYPLLCCVSEEVGIKVMVMVSFAGVKKEGFRVGRAVLPKFFLQDVGLEGFEMLRRSRRRVCVSRMPRVMVEGFLKDYLEVEVVLGRELRELRGYYTGLMQEEEDQSKSKAMELESDKLLGGEDAWVVGIGGHTDSLHHFSQRCKEIYLISEGERKKWEALPRSRYPNPLVFHDGRIAFTPTPSATLCMFLWLPFAFPLGVVRAAIFHFLPYPLSISLLAFTGMHSTVLLPSSSTSSSSYPPSAQNQLFVCNHRTLLDPIYVSAIIRRHLTATTYSLSRFSEVLSPIKTIRLSRNKEVDRTKIEALLNEGGVVICPEGTTCREPYLLRFSSLFVELRREIVPVALDSKVGMFYGTTAGGFKSLDPVYFLMNPVPCYKVHILEKVDTCYDDNGEEKELRSRHEIANYIQGEIGKALGFECTALTRKDKYLMLAGNEGVVEGIHGG
ncbi:probable glycerol-3-phosphate acyltransferase 3 [Typha latifolia]|uniref:probable glycerol-3-phosphate acyltransferase 3 n=1 Tax=Typha latifolia TaxID=4733 RepID=UPI003C30DD8F